MTRSKLLLGLLLGLSGCLVGDEAAPMQKPSEVPSGALIGGATYATLAGVGGTVTTLATYGDGTPHPGVNAIDIGAPGGSAVFHQVDYLGPEIAGGWSYAVEAHEAGLCSGFYPGQSSYNGAKIYVYTYYYDTAGTFVGTSRAAFQHVDPYAPNMGHWWAWNNAGAAVPAWSSGTNFSYGGQTADGLYLGTVFPVSNPVYNTNGSLCTTGSHLHQENDGPRASKRYVGESVTARYSDLHFFVPATAMPLGAPPHPPVPGT